jgi:hypothetical protein
LSVIQNIFSILNIGDGLLYQGEKLAIEKSLLKKYKSEIIKMKTEHCNLLKNAK